MFSILFVVGVCVSKKMARLPKRHLKKMTFSKKMDLAPGADFFDIFPKHDFPGPDFLKYFKKVGGASLEALALL